MRKNGDLPKEIISRFRSSGHCNPASVKLWRTLRRQHQSDRDLQIPMHAAIRQAVGGVPWIPHRQSSGSGGFIRVYERPRSPCSGSPTADRQLRYRRPRRNDRRYRREENGRAGHNRFEMIKRFAPELKQSGKRAADMRIPVHKLAPFSRRTFRRSGGCHGKWGDWGKWELPPKGGLMETPRISPDQNMTQINERLKTNDLIIVRSEALNVMGCTTCR